jgi:general secretion pathway protein K
MPMRTSDQGIVAGESACPTSQRGSALLTVLWLTAALSAIGIAVASNVRSETERTTTSLDDVKAYFAARGAIERTAMRFFWGYDYYVPGTPAVEVNFPEAAVHVDIIPETSKLNVNYAEPETLLRLLTALGEPPAAAEELAAAILDWRTPLTPDHPSPLDSFYLAQSPSFLARHASLQQNEELLLIKGMTSDLYFGDSLSGRSGLRECLSVYGAGSSVNVMGAQAATMVALGLSPEEAAAVVRRRTERPILPEELAEIQQALGPAGQQLTMARQTIYTLRATARLRTPDGKLSDMRRTAAALVKFHYAGNRQGVAPGFEVINWYDRP